MEMTRAQFDTLLGNIVRAQARATKEIGKALLGVLYFANVASDAEPANALIGALRKSTKKTAIVDLLQTHGNLAWMTVGRKESSFDYFDAGHTADTWKTSVKELRQICENWEDFKVEKAAEDLDFLAGLERLLKKADTAKKAGRPVLNDGLVEMVRATVGKFAAEKIAAQAIQTAQTAQAAITA